MTPHGIPLSYDRLDERSKAQERDIAALQRQMTRVEGKLDDVIATLSEAKGGWRTLMLIGGAGGLIGAILTRFTPWLTGSGN